METLSGQSSRYGYHLWIALICLVVSGFMLLAYVLWSAYHDVWADARSVADSQSELLEARFESTLRRIEATLDDVAERLPKESLVVEAMPHFRVDIEKELQRSQRVFPEVAGFRIIAADGNVLYRSGGGDYANLADRSYFRLPKERGGTDLVLSEVISSRITGRATIVAARGIRSADGEFMGVVSAAIELGYFEALFKSVRLGASGALVIRRSDTHTLVVRQPPVPSEINRPLDPSHPIYQRIVAGDRQGVMEFVAQADGKSRVYGYRVL